MSKANEILKKAIGQKVYLTLSKPIKKIMQNESLFIELCCNQTTVSIEDYS
jgi:hypothetical protein